MDQAALATLHGKIDRLNDNIDTVKKEKQQKRLGDHISKIKEAVYNPILVSMLDLDP